MSSLLGVFILGTLFPLSRQNYVNITPNFRHEASNRRNMSSVSLADCLTQNLAKNWTHINFKSNANLCEIIFESPDGRSVSNIDWVMATPFRRNSVNVAVEGIATQSSTYDGDLRGATMVNDGVLAHSTGEATGCSHTNDEVGPWLLIDLLRVYEIEYVVIYNRIEESQPFTNARTSGFTLSISMLKDSQITREQSVEMVNIRTKQFPVHSYGRYVRVHSKSREKKIYSACEIQVYAYS